MKLASLLNEELIFLHSSVPNYQEAVQQLIRKVYEKYSFEIDKEVIEQAVNERESLGGTVMPTGLAVPHGRLEGFNDLIVAVCIPGQAIEVNNTPVKMIVLILTSKTASKLYLNTLAALVALSKDQAMFEKLTACKRPHEVYELVDSANIEVKKELNVSDIMNPEVIRITPEYTVKQVVDLFFIHKTAYFPVINAQNRLIGEVTVMDLLKKGIPDYAMRIGNLKFLHNFEPFEELLSNEDKISVAEIMRKPEVTLSPDSSIIETAMIMMTQNRRYFSVVENGEVLGAVSYMDIVNKVLRG